MSELLYRKGEKFTANGHQIEITRDVPWSGWPRWGDILVDGVALKSGDSGSRVSWQGRDQMRRSRLRSRAAV
jgi:hypothetical protein